MLSFANNSLGGLGGGLGFWGDKAFLMPRLGDGNQSTQIGTTEIRLPLNAQTQLNYFYELNQSGELQGQGLGYTHDFGPLAINGSVGYSSSSSNGFGFKTDRGSQRLLSVPIKFGVRLPLWSNVEAFGYLSKRTVSDLAASSDNWGISGGYYKANAFGVEWQSPRGERLSFGLFTPEHLARGTASLIAPSGRLPDGTILWRAHQYDISGQQDPAFFLAARFHLSKIHGLVPKVRFQVQTDPVRGHAIEQSSVHVDLDF
jgi:hypothetical protein